MVGPHSLEVVMHVAELADVAWSARERHLEHVAVERELELGHVQTEAALDRERLENEKLRAAIKVYENALQKELERQGSDRSLEESLHLSRETSVDLYDELKIRLESGAFLKKLQDLPPVVDGDSSSVMKTDDDVFVNANAEDPNWWLLVNDDDLFGSEIKEEKDGLDSEGYVVVNQDDFVDGIAYFLAKYVSSMPQAKHLSPVDLQKTLLKAFTDVEKKGRIRKLWETAKLLYTATSWGATVFGIYKHPMVIRAASMAVWTSCSLILAMLR